MIHMTVTVSYCMEIERFHVVAGDTDRSLPATHLSQNYGGSNDSVR